MGLKHNDVRLRTFFIQYLLALFIGFVLIVSAGVGVFFISLTTGCVLSLSDVEAQIGSQKAKISSAKTVDASLIPATCNYAVVNSTGTLLSGSMTKSDAAIAWDTIQQGRTTSGEFMITGLNVKCYFPIQRQSETCIIEYSSMSQFSSTFLREHLPAPEFVLFWAICIAFLFEIFLLSIFFGRKISRKLLPLQNATEKIQNKDLEFEIQYSGIKEIDAALQSLGSMKDELKKSLENQWQIEQTKKMQISALAHDIKTPLTVIRGNVEMLNDTDQTKEQQEFTCYIMKNADRMEQYIQMLMDISNAEAGYSLQLEKVDLKVFLNDMKSQISAIASIKQLQIEFAIKELPETITVDLSLLQRALMNVISNAVDYSPEHGTIYFTSATQGSMIRFTVTDCGKGFSPAGLKNAAKQFYQDDTSRSSKSHYGMGLFIANSIALQHGGTLSIENSSATGGGMVIIEIPS